jgi:Holliday junction resolvase RusA-like endonuclease
VVYFWVAGRPQQRGSKTAFKVGDKIAMTDSNKQSGPWMAAVRHEASVAYRGNKLLAGPIHLECQFFFKRPQADWGTGRNSGQLKASAPRYHIKQPDLSKLVRTIEDALTGVIYRDDKQITICESDKSWTETQEGVQIVVTELQDGYD